MISYAIPNIAGNEYNVRDLALYILGPIVSHFKRKNIQTWQYIPLRRKKEIVSAVVMIDWFSLAGRYFKLIIEAEGLSLEEATKQCLL